MLRLAYFSPLPPAPAGIADYSKELLPFLSDLAHLTLFSDEPEKIDNELRKRFQIVPTSAYGSQRWEYDLALYHMGNHGLHHASIGEMALRYPGVVVFHEVILHDYTAYITVGQRDFAAYARELGYELGSAGYELAWQERIGRMSRPVHSIPFNKRLIGRSLGLVVHSRSAADLVAQQGVELPLAVIPQLAVSRDVPSLRHRLELPAETTVFAATGLVNDTKRIDQSLDAFYRLKAIEPEAFFLIVGGAHTDVDLPRLIRQRRLQKSVHWTGRVETLEEFVGWTAAADVVVSLRHPTLGETSSAAVRALAAGKPLIVYDQGWYGELPDDLCIKVPPLEPDPLLEAMLTLARDPIRRQEMGLASRSFAGQQLDPHRIAGQYIRFLKRVVAATGTVGGAKD